MNSHFGFKIHRFHGQCQLFKCYAWLAIGSSCFRILTYIILYDLDDIKITSEKTLKYTSPGLSRFIFKSPFTRTLVNLICDNFQFFFWNSCSDLNSVPIKRINFVTYHVLQDGFDIMNVYPPILIFVKRVKYKSSFWHSYKDHNQSDLVLCDRNWR